MIPIDEFKYKILSIYDTTSKTYFKLDLEKGIEVVSIAEKEKLDIAKPKQKIIKTPQTVRVIGSGSGFYVTSNGHIITNNHVVNKCEKILLNNEKLEVLSISTKNDLALLKSYNPNSSFLYLRQGKIKQGEDIVVIGFPYGKEISSEVTITKGIVSSLNGIGDDETKIQIDAAIQPGNSGGPTIGLDGRVVGVTVASANIGKFLKDFGSLPQNMNFSVKPNFVIQLLVANEIEIPSKENNKRMNSEEIFALASPSTVYLECWGKN